MIRVGIVGSSGYTGGEMIRILLRHPGVHIAYLASRTHAGSRLCDVSEAFTPSCELRFEPLDIERMLERCDVIFTAVPHGAAMDFGPAVQAADKRLIDIGTDFRFRDSGTFEEWYKVQHTCPDLAASAAYGLPELFRPQIQQSRIVGNPGCYPTSVLLGIAPLVKGGLIELDRIQVTSMSGASGAGASPSQMLHLPEAVENVRPYGVAGHRHTPEIEQGIALLLRETGSASTGPRISFTPHLVPMSRGILSTLVLYPATSTSQDEIQAVFEAFYQGEAFVRVLSGDRLPQTKPLRGTNMCHLAVRYDSRAGRIIVMSAIDNLGKGAAGQAVQNMNLLFGQPESAGLDLAGMFP